MKKYRSFFRIRFAAGMQYRAAAWAGIATQAAWGAMEILMFRAFYAGDPAGFPMTFAQLSGYVWLQQALLAMFMTWYYDSEIFEHITGGSIAYELCRPCDLYTMWFVKNAAARMSRAALRSGPILLVAALLPAPYGLRLPADAMAAALFVPALVLGFLVVVAFSMLVYISAFYTVSADGVKILVTSVLEFFTGGVIPIPFFPVWLQRVVYALPFGSMQNMPYLIYTGQLAGTAALKGLALQLAWLAVLLTAGKLWMGRAMNKVVVQGG